MSQKQIMHRDLKLENIMVHFPGKSKELLNYSKDQKKQFYKIVDMDKEDFVIKIADLGFSKSYEDTKVHRGTVCGTYLFMAPELYNKKKYSYKVDVWAVGVILFNMLNGVTPFDSSTM